MKIQFLDKLKDIQKDTQAQRTVELVTNSILVLLLIALIGRSVVVSVFSLRNQQEELRGIANALAVRRTNIQSAEKEVADYTNSFDLLTEAMPLSPKQFDMLNQIQLAAETEGVVIDQLSHKSSGPGIVEFTTLGNGKYEQVVRFIKRVEQLPRIIQIADISLNGGSTEDTNDPKVSFTINGSGYYYTEDVTLLYSDDVVAGE